MDERVTIHDVARVAGVSRQTVTRAMNSMSEISEQTRDRVLAVSEQLGYRPSRFAANMAKQKSHTIGLLVPSLQNPYFTDLATHLLEEMEPHRWQLSVAARFHIDDVETMRRLSHEVDVIVGHFSPAQVSAAPRGGTPLVLLEDGEPSGATNTVHIDLEAGVIDLVTHLVGSGVRSVGFIDVSRGPRGSYVQSVRGGLIAKHLRPHAELFAVEAKEESLEGGAMGLEELLRDHPQIDTLIAYNDLMAVGAMRAAREGGLAVPGRLRIVGIDGIAIGTIVTPTLSTVAIDTSAVARAAVHIIENILRPSDKPPRPAPDPIRPNPIWRESA